MSWVGLRAAALVAALLLAVLSRGDVIVLALLLALGAWRPLPAIGVVTALGAAAWRWSSMALEDIAGAQAVLGPAGVVDPSSAAAGAWLGALALVVATPNLVEAWLMEGAPTMSIPRWWKRALEWVSPLAFGASAAVVVAGPSSVDDLWIRGLATLVAVALASTVSRRRRVLHRPFVVDALSAALGLASLVAVAVDAPPLDGLLDTDALIQGIALAVAVGLLAGATVSALNLRAGRRLA